MSTLKLKGSTSGYVELTAPATAGNNTITLPTGSGTVVVGDGSGNVTITGVTTVSAGSTSAPSITPSGDPNTGVFFPSADTIAFAEGGTEVARFDSSGRLLVGSTSSAYVAASDGNTGLNVGALIKGTNSGYNQNGSLVLNCTNGGPELFLYNSESVSTSGRMYGSINFCAIDSGYFNLGRRGASISAFADNTTGTGDFPGRLVFSTTADGASSPTERMRITNSGEFLFNTTSNFGALGGAGSGGLGIIFEGATGRGLFVASGNSPLIINRTTNDGDLITFRQDGTQEGTISVSGTTVSYNGAHLSRWSQLPSGAERTEILRGTVLSNLDEMCEWGEEDNEQLNRMKVSDVEGDKNVAGVFQAWDDDDDTYTNDFYCAMTGDFIIRIGSGVTVERGDLLMSAGDGTAKPQDDDIVRSKTVAKVTSTSVTCTYDDGSYCVPCVLMAC